MTILNKDQIKELCDEFEWYEDWKQRNPGWFRDPKGRNGRLYCMILDTSTELVQIGKSVVPHSICLNGAGAVLHPDDEPVYLRWYPDEGLMAANSRGEIFDPQPTVPNE